MKKKSPHERPYERFVREYMEGYASGEGLKQIAARLNATPSQVALAWVLRRSPVMLPIPGTGKVRHLEENVAAAALTLSDEDFRALDALGRAEWENGQQARD